MDRILINTLLKWSTVALATGVMTAVVVTFTAAPYRWLWWFASPNDLGAVAASTLPLWLALPFSHTRPQKTFWIYIITIFLIAGTICLLSALIGSGSRGAWVAAISTLIIGALLPNPKVMRIAYAAIAASILIGIFLLPKASTRISRTDESIQSRLELWSETSVMITDNPLGWGTGNFADIHDKWYKLRERDAFMWHPLNDCLYIASEHGLQALWILCAVYFSLLISLKSGPLRREPGADAIFLSLFSFFISGMFTTLMRSGGAMIYLLPLLTVGITLAVRRKAPIVRSAAMGSILSFIFIIFIWSLCIMQQGKYAWKPSTNCLTEVSPRYSPILGKLLILQRDEDDTYIICKSVLRPLAAMGFQSLLISQSDFVSNSHASDLNRFAPQCLISLTGSDSFHDFSDLRKVYLGKLQCAVFLDRDASGLHLEIPTLLINGLSSSNSRNLIPKNFTVINIPVPKCWARNFKMFSSELMAWISRNIYN